MTKARSFRDKKSDRQAPDVCRTCRISLAQCQSATRTVVLTAQRSLISMGSSLVSDVMVYFKPDVSGSWYFGGSSTGSLFGSGGVPGPPDPFGVATIPTFT